ncbi:MAG: hypothetical protein A2V98_00205 [Planctomycetes bacterium RBG_16_64_12]|nr:MAG: hypothetical protein A2V98_00205 [Planctomycetes bacterium RBG_16_64_12]
MSTQSGRRASEKGWPLHGWLGLGLIALFWTLNWSLPGLRTHWGFFPLWLGYCLTVDALVLARKGDSMLVRNPGAYVALFVISAPAWWLFEFLNWRTENWLYEGRKHFTDLQYSLLASLSFSTVMPAVFGTAELVSTFRWLRRMRPGPVVAPTRATLLVLFVTGWLTLALLLVWPRYFFPFLWASVYLILEPVNVLLGNRSLIGYTAQREWRPILALSVGCLICGFFWEMWNFYCYPKWIYQIPLVDFLPVFEMPLLGYCGYVVFSWELFALYHLVAGLLKEEEQPSFIQVCPD